MAKSDVSITLLELKGIFIVPDMQSFDDHNSPFQYFSPLSATARMKPKKCKDGVSPPEFDELVLKLSELPRSVVLMSTSKIDSVATNRDHISNFCQVFAGG